MEDDPIQNRLIDLSDVSRELARRMSTDSYLSAGLDLDNSAESQLDSSQEEQLSPLRSTWENYMRKIRDKRSKEDGMYSFSSASTDPLPRFVAQIVFRKRIM